LNLLREKHDLPVLPKGTLKEFSGDKEIDAKRNLHLFLNVFYFHHVEYDDAMVLGYEKGINIFLFPTFHDIIVIDFSVI
jgi:hypothetical protein